METDFLQLQPLPLRLCALISVSLSCCPRRLSQVLNVSREPVTNLRGGPAFLDHKQPPTIFRVRRTLQGSLGHAYLLQIRSHFSGRDGWASELVGRKKGRARSIKPQADPRFSRANPAIGDSHGTASVKQQRIQANVVLQPEPARPATQASSYPSTRMAFSKSTPKSTAGAAIRINTIQL
ncbi:hypothetical protein CTAM01_10464 [Colletotrichum tamarilloi]|uniref:Secreted protein n=1 Tax=Colletotrichum tamarilloi TaxID=1209934 RepID=A0ABQ9R0Z1_9PEZI|nr:uncharacterized protein CTAM01_10464 [Colletotrichum tamarilloi]KAK1490971.1 hypothetical protein CTAM01_10464 [Colletotrichum tamarilloi]